MDVMTDSWTFGNTVLFTLNSLWSNIQKSGSLYTEHTCMQCTHVTPTEMYINQI
jgi:hypothetical protein